MATIARYGWYEMIYNGEWLVRVAISDKIVDCVRAVAEGEDADPDFEAGTYLRCLFSLCVFKRTGVGLNATDLNEHFTFERIRDARYSDHLTEYVRHLASV